MRIRALVAAGNLVTRGTQDKPDEFARLWLRFRGAHEGRR